MSIAITAEHRQLAETVARWAAAHLPPSVPRSWLDAADVARASRGDGHDQQLVVGDTSALVELGEQGLLGLHLPEEVGGAGYGMVEVAVVLEQLGRVIAPGAVLPTLLASRLLARDHGAPLAKELLPGLADGSRTGAVAVGAAPLDAVAGADGGLVVTGAVEALLAGATPDVLLLPIALDGATRWVAVDGAAVVLEPRTALDATRAVARVVLDGVAVAADRVVGDLDTALVEQTACTLAAAEAAGIAQWCTDTAAAHARTRVQFGRPIGAFQAVKHLCAGMLVRTEQARAAAWDAAVALDDPAQAPLASAVAASVALEAAVTAAKDCIQVLGGIGFTWEHEAHLYLKRALAVRQWIGGASRWNRVVADLALSGSRRVLDLDLGEEAGPVRQAVRAELAEIAAVADGGQRRQRLAAAGYLAPHWPRPWGRDAGPVEQLVIDEEVRAAGIGVPSLVIGAWVLPTLIAHGTPDQQERFIPPTLGGDITWCQMFSEPEAGSDLAALRTRATRTDGGWVLQGQKVWTSLAQHADWAICLARTNPHAPKHQGITYFLLDMTTPGIDIRPLREITGDAMFNEVFLNDVVVPDDCVVGEVDGGWALARATLANERVAMASGTTMGRGVEGLLATLSAHPAAADPCTRQRVGALVCEGQTLSLLGFRTTLSQLGGLDPGSGASVRKLVGMDHAQEVAEMLLELTGPAGIALAGRRDDLAGGLLQTRALTIAGGTTQVQRNVVAERILGLPRDEEPTR